MQGKTCFPAGRFPVAHARRQHKSLEESEHHYFSAKLAPALSAAIKSPIGGGNQRERENLLHRKADE